MTVAFLTVLIALSHVYRFWMVRTLIVPLGLYKVAYYGVLSSQTRIQEDPNGTALLAAAWSLCRKYDVDGEAWVHEKLQELPRLGGAGIAAAGFLAAARGDRETARQLLRSAIAMDEAAYPKAARRAAVSWLVADAAARGDWRAVAELGESMGDGSREAWLLSAVAQSLHLDPFSPGRLGLWLRWLIAPNRRATLPIVERAVLALNGAFIEPERESLPPFNEPVQDIESDPWARALHLHASLLATQPALIQPEDVKLAALAWDNALSGAGHRVDDRARVLGLSGGAGGASVLYAFAQAIEEDLSAVVKGSEIPLGSLASEGDGLAERVRRRLRDELLTEIEGAVRALAQRTEDKRELPPVDEWREWLYVASLYERGAERVGDDFRRLAFATLHSDACAFAVWHFNERSQRPIGNAVFRWLLREAERVEDERAATLQRKNVAIGI